MANLQAMNGTNTSEQLKPIMIIHTPTNQRNKIPCFSNSFKETSVADQGNSTGLSFLI
jgi:hypothetical protein